MVMLHSIPLQKDNTLLPSSQLYSDGNVRDPEETLGLMPLPVHRGCSVGTQQAREHTQAGYSPR